MLYKGVLTRALPFFLTFAAGLFIASFFVSIATPSFSFPRKSYRYNEMQRIRTENQELKRTNCELRKQLDEARRNSETRFSVDGDLPIEPTVPPPPPVAPRHSRFDN